MTTNESTTQKLGRLMNGEVVIMSDDQLDSLCPFDLSNLIRSKPNSNQIGTKDRWECWIERRDLKRFSDANFGDAGSSDKTTRVLYK